MESAITKLVDVFKNYAGKDKTLGKNEFQKLVATELKNWITNPEDKVAVKEFQDKFDKDKNKKISFDEYLILVTQLAKIKYKQQ